MCENSTNEWSRRDREIGKILYRLESGPQRSTNMRIKTALTKKTKLLNFELDREVEKIYHFNPRSYRVCYLFRRIRLLYG